MRASGLLDLGSPASRMAAAAEALTTENGWALIEWLPRLRDWALLACLICPGTLDIEWLPFEVVCNASLFFLFKRLQSLGSMLQSPT